MNIAPLAHDLLIAALAVPLVGLALIVFTLSFGVAWRQKGRR